MRNQFSRQRSAVTQRMARFGTTLSGFALLLLGQACGARYEIGEIEPPIGGLEPPPGEEVTGAEGIVPVLIVDGPEDADAELAGRNNNVMPQGDIDGDGFGDWVDFGQVTYGGPRPAQGLTIDGEFGAFFTIRGVERFGTRVVGPVDFNGDGYSDMLVESATGYERPAIAGLSPAELAAENERKAEFLRFVAETPAFLWYGGPERGCCGHVLDDEAAGFRMTDDLIGSLRAALLEREDVERRGDFRIGAQSLGDLDGDGYDDLAVTASLTRSTQHFYPEINGSGMVSDGTESMTHIYYGRRDRLAVGVQPEPDARLADVFLQALGDVNGDGYDDFLAGGYVIGGSAERLPARPVPAATGVPLLVADTPVDISALGDVDGDGFDEFSIGVYNDVEGPFNSLQVSSYLFYGSPSLLQGPIDRSASSAEIVTNRDVRGAGDWNGDGTSDLLIWQSANTANGYYRDGLSVVAGTSKRFSGRQEVPLVVPTEGGSGGVTGPFGIGDADGDGRADIFFQGGSGPSGPPRSKWFVKYGGPLDTTTSIH